MKRSSCTRVVDWSTTDVRTKPTYVVNAADADAWAKRKLCPSDHDRVWVLSPLWSVIECGHGSVEHWVCTQLSDSNPREPNWTGSRACDELLYIELAVFVGDDWQLITEHFEGSDEKLCHILNLRQLQAWGPPSPEITEKLERARDICRAITARRAAHLVLESEVA